MNWFTKEFLDGRVFSLKLAAFKNNDTCEHILKPEDLHVVLYENDSFGNEGRAVCKVCYNKIKEEDNVEVVCCDCLNVFLAKDTIEWKWYDFYTPQGDEPLIICNSCKCLPKHLKRIERDARMYKEEFGDD
jgi:hypothetical protein